MSMPPRMRSAVLVCVAAALCARADVVDSIASVVEHDLPIDDAVHEDGSAAVTEAAEPSAEGAKKKKTRQRLRDTCAQELGLVTDKETAVRFAKFSQSFCNVSSPWAEKHGQLPLVLGFVAPWNTYGYKASKYFRGKLSHVSPLWFRVLPPEDPTEGIPFEIAGSKMAEDQDRWKADVQTDSCQEERCAEGPAVLPHFSLEGFASLDALKAVLDNPGPLAEEIAVICKHEKYSGIVFDVRLALFRGVKVLLPNFIMALSKELRAYGKDFMISVPAALPSANVKGPDFDAADAAAAADYVDAIIVGTRDFSRDEFGPSAPLPWVRSTMNRLLAKKGMKGSGVPANKLVLEIPVYARTFPAEGGEGTVTITQELVKVLARERPELVWDPDAAEHSASLKSGAQVALASLRFVSDRIQLARSFGVGVALRDLGAGLDYTFDLLPIRSEGAVAGAREEL